MISWLSTFSKRLDANINIDASKWKTGKCEWLTIEIDEINWILFFFYQFPNIK